jgi:hypothetical protein
MNVTQTLKALREDYMKVVEQLDECIRVVHLTGAALADAHERIDALEELLQQSAGKVTP